MSITDACPIERYRKFQKDNLAVSEKAPATCVEKVIFKKNSLHIIAGFQILENSVNMHNCSQFNKTDQCVHRPFPKKS